jgi:hypothetical protein
MRKIYLPFLLFSSLFLTGCPDYDKVRQMSAMQLAKQKEFKTLFENYTTNVYNFAKIKVEEGKAALTVKEGQVAQNIQATGDAEIAALPAADVSGRNARRQQIGAELLQNQQSYKAKRDELDKLLVSLQAKHREILDTYQVLIDAQTELDRFVQLKRFDERAVDAVIQRISVNQDKLNQRINEANGILSTIAPPPAP